MNDVPRRPAAPGASRRPEADAERSDASGPERASVDQLRLRPTERRFGEALPTDGPNGQSSTPMRVARPSDPGSVVGLGAAGAPDGAEEVADRRRGVPAPDDWVDRDEERAERSETP